MARPGLTQHRKFLRLARVLGSAPLALGVLEFMWEKGYQNGDPYIGDEIDVEAACQWNGPAGVLTQALMSAGGDGNQGFLERAPDRTGYQIHDLFDHAPRYVGTRLEREIARQEKGLSLSKLRSDAGKKGAEASKRAATERSVAGQRAATEQQNGATPLPAPLKDVPPLPPNGGMKERRPRKLKTEMDCTPEVEPLVRMVYDSWPKESPNGEPAHKGSFALAARAFQKIVNSGEASARELKGAGMLYAKAEQYPEVKEQIYAAWDHRDHAIMHVATFYGPEKRPYRQLLPLAKEAIARADAKKVAV